MKSIHAMNRTELLEFLRERELELAQLSDENEELRAMLHSRLEREATARANDIIRAAEFRCVQREAAEQQRMNRQWLEFKARMAHYGRTHPDPDNTAAEFARQFANTYGRQ